MSVGKLIYKRRSELGLTLEEVGNLVGVSKSTVKKWESGNISNMRRDKIALLADALKISPIDLIVEKGNTSVSNSFTLTEHEQNLVAAYREHPDRQNAVDILLGISHT